VSHRPLVLVSGLTVGDYLLWNWSLNGNHDVLALVSGLTLPPLALATLWLLALSAARLIARSTRRTTKDVRFQGRPAATDGAAPEERPAAAESPGTSSGKIAA
jgi:hypothetical protein